MIRYNYVVNLIFAALLAMPLASVALPIKITVLNINVGKHSNELILIYDCHVEDSMATTWDRNAYLQQWNGIILQYRHNFLWYCEGIFNNFLNESIPNFTTDNSRDYFMERPVQILGKLSSAAVDVRLLGNIYLSQEMANGPTLPYLNETQLSTVLTCLKEAQQSINNYGSDTAKKHAAAVIEHTEQDQHLPYETKTDTQKWVLNELHDVSHFDMVALGSILYALANYSQPCVLICGADHADNLIELLCANQRATILREDTSREFYRIFKAVTISDDLSFVNDPSYEGLRNILTLTSLSNLTKISDYVDQDAQTEQLLLQELFLAQENHVARQHLPHYIPLAQIETVLAEVAARNPIQHSALRSRP